MAVISSLKSRYWRVAPLIPMLMLMGVAGCGGKVKLNPTDLKVFVAKDLNAPKEDLDVTTTFRTNLVIKVNYMNVEEAQAAMREFIGSCNRYFQRDQVKDFLNDTLVFVIQLKTDRDQNLKWSAIKEDVRDLVAGNMSPEQFYERCLRTESWSMELE
jgi:hypothetical protein